MPVRRLVPRSVLIGAVTVLAAAAGAPSAVGDPAAIRAQRAQIERIQAQVTALDDAVERAAEAYNGARWRLGVIRRRIAVNRAVLATAARDLTRARATLSRRLRDLYRQERPSLAEVVLTSGSVALIVERLGALERIGEQDRHVVANIRDFEARMRRARRGLILDRHLARAQVAQAHRARERVEALLVRRRQVLRGAKGELRRLLAEERERQRRLAELARQRALAAQRAREAQAALAPSLPLAGPLPSGRGNAAAVGVAMRYLGVPYVWGGASPAGFDCSGLASYAYAQIGKSVPHFTGAIWSSFPQVPRGREQPGDLAFFNGGGHVGIYIGNGQFVHAPHTGDVVRVADLGARADYIGAVRP
jgi:peptidoglycan hydrolase CwlO-like protein